MGLDSLEWGGVSEGVAADFKAHSIHSGGLLICYYYYLLSLSLRLVSLSVCLSMVKWFVGSFTLFIPSGMS